MIRKSVVLLCIAAALVFWSFNGLILERHGHNYWAPIDEHTFWLARPVRLALHRPPPSDAPGPMRWRTLAAGFDVAELPVLVGREEVDRIFLARIDPAHFRFELQNDRANQSNLDRWMQRTGAALVVNASYFGRDVRPATPAIMAGRPAGPANYTGTHGAFVSSPQSAEIVDLAHQDWRVAFRGARTAFVSYPLLIAPDGQSRTAADAGWLANRSFIGQDRNGFTIIGTTKSGFHIAPARQLSAARTTQFADRTQSRWRTGGLPGRRARKLPAHELRTLGSANGPRRPRETIAWRSSSSQHAARDHAACARRLSS